MLNANIRQRFQPPKSVKLCSLIEGAFRHIRLRASKTLGYGGHDDGERRAVCTNRALVVTPAKGGCDESAQYIDGMTQTTKV